MQTMFPVDWSASAQSCLCQTKLERDRRSPWDEGALPERELRSPLFEEHSHFLVAAARLAQEVLPEKESGDPLLEEHYHFLAPAAKLAQG
eukprot:scaffold291247_cov19-Tisochrysis_lutea.AAC.1